MSAKRVTHPFRLLLARLPWPLSELAWMELINPAKNGWREE
jgi:hypothetical protein